jgi:hypothetical protein
MRTYAKSWLIAGSLLISAGLLAQEVYRPPDPDLLAKLSYDSSAVDDKEAGLQHICIAVSRGEEYRIVRLLRDGMTQRLHGKLTTQQFQQLKSLLGSSDFRALSGNNSGLIRRDSKSFAAEIPRSSWRGEGGAQKLQWLDADGENPFPGSVANVVDWLKHFDPKDGKLFEYADYPDVCPSGGLRLLQPSVATNQHP